MSNKHLEDLILINDNEQRAIFLLAQGLHEEFRPMYDTYLTHYVRHLQKKIPDRDCKYLAFKETEKEYQINFLLNFII